MSDYPPPPPPPGGGYGYAAASPKQSPKALWSLITGVASVPLCFCYIGIISGAVAIVLGFSARGDIRDAGGMLSGSGLALAGIICGITGFVLSVLSVALVIVLDATDFSLV